VSIKATRRSSGLLVSEARNDLAWWFPKIERAGLPVPRTEIVQTDLDLSLLLDGKLPGHGDAFTDFLADLLAAADQVRHGHDPFFLRTGHGSAKHEWRETCYVQGGHIGDHVMRLVEWSHMVDVMGLPHSTWAVRALIPTRTLFTVEEWRGFPVTREFRVFASGLGPDEPEPTCTFHPYWPESAFPALDDVQRAQVQAMGKLTWEESEVLTMLAARATYAVGGGYWSIDFLEDVDGKFWLTDMADGERSFKNPVEAVPVVHGRSFKPFNG
jgi:hypothetical protein